jgi:hypothetical protein
LSISKENKLGREEKRLWEILFLRKKIIFPPTHRLPEGFLSRPPPQAAAGAGGGGWGCLWTASLWLRRVYNNTYDYAILHNKVCYLIKMLLHYIENIYILLRLKK